MRRRKKNEWNESGNNYVKWKIGIDILNVMNLTQLFLFDDVYA